MTWLRAFTQEIASSSPGCGYPIKVPAARVILMPTGYASPVDGGVGTGCGYPSPVIHRAPLTVAESAN
jgi:hypothetical protein